MFINKSILMDAPNGWEMLDTVLEEGYHAYQHHIIFNPQEYPDLRQVELWGKNYVAYINEGGGYRFQPLERDAKKFAHEQVDLIAEEMMNHYGADDTYHEYREKRLMIDKKYSDLAREEFGENFIEEIDKVVVETADKIMGQLNESEQKEEGETGESEEKFAPQEEDDKEAKENNEILKKVIGEELDEYKPFEEVLEEYEEFETEEEPEEVEDEGPEEVPVEQKESGEESEHENKSEHLGITY